MHEIVQKIKRWTQTPEIITVAIIVLVGLASFGLGRLSALESKREPVRILRAQVAEENVKHPMSNISREGANESSSSGLQLPTSNFQSGGQLVGSKNGTKYHFPWCSGAERIKEENKKWFDSIAAARAAGYSPAANCKGLE